MTNEKPQQDTQKPKEGKENKKVEKEINGFEDAGLLEPTRYNDWEVKGRCSDF